MRELTNTGLKPNDNFNSKTSGMVKLKELMETELKPNDFLCTRISRMFNAREQTDWIKAYSFIQGCVEL